MADRPQILDMRGRACPEPVVRTLEALAASAPPVHLVVRVDDPASAENVRRAAESRGREVELVERGPGDLEVHVRGTGGAPPVAACDATTPRVALLLASDKLGHGDDELGGVLMRAFVKTLREVSPRPRWLLLLNAGVRLACEGSPVLAELQALVAAGVTLRACGTCLDFYRLKDRLRVGEVGNMLDTVSVLMQADRVVRP